MYNNDKTNTYFTWKNKFLCSLKVDFHLDLSFSCSNEVCVNLLVLRLASKRGTILKSKWVEQ